MTSLKDLPKVQVLCIADLGSFSYKFEEIESNAEVDLKLSIWLRKEDKDGNKPIKPMVGQAYWVKVNENWITFIEPAELDKKEVATPVKQVTQTTTSNNSKIASIKKVTPPAAIDTNEKAEAVAKQKINTAAEYEGKTFDELAAERVILPDLKNSLARKEFYTTIGNANNAAATMLQPVIGHIAADKGVENIDAKVILNLFLELRDGIANDFMTRFYK